MFYLLLIVPHLVALGGLFAFAFRAEAGRAGDEEPGGFDGNDGGQQPPLAPQPTPSGGGLPLLPMSQCSPPHRRLHVGERLSELHPPQPRRGVEPNHPQRTPANAESDRSATS